MDMYDFFCLILCIFAVFGGYIALRIAARAALRQGLRREDGADCRERHADCHDCRGNRPDCRADCRERHADCPVNGTTGSGEAKRD